MTDVNTAPEGATEAPQRPFLTVLRGNPDDTQVAALTAVFASLAANSAPADPAAQDVNLWGNLDDRLRNNLAVNPGAFRNVHYY